MSYRTDRQRVHGLGAAGDGTHHWWSQRLTSIALVPLTLFFLFPFVRALGAGLGDGARDLRARRSTPSSRSSSCSSASTTCTRASRW